MSDPIRHGTDVFRRSNLSMFAAGVATFGALYCVQPLMPEFSRFFGVSAARSALSLSLTSAVLAGGLLVAGPLSDAWGRKSLMSLSLYASALLVLLSSAAPNWPCLLAVRAVLGVCLCGVPAVAMAYLSEEIHPESLGLAMGLYISGSAVGGMGARLLVGVLTDWFSWRIGLAAVGVIGLVAATVFARSLPPSRHFVARPLELRALPGRFAALFDDAGLPWLFAEGFVLLGAFVTMYNYIGYRLLAAPYHLSQSAVGLIFSVYLVGTVSSPWIGQIAGRLGRRKVLWTMFVTMLAGIALTILTPLWLIVAGISIATFGFFGGHSIVSSWVGRRAGNAKAQASSIYLFAYYMGSSIAGAVGGLFYADAGWHGVVLFVAILWGSGLAIAWRLSSLLPLAAARAAVAEVRSSVGGF
jgi:YNFM family putative membrane transporter